MKTKLHHRYDFHDPHSIRLSSRSLRFIVIIILLVIISFQLSSLMVPPPTTRFLLWFDGDVDNKNLTTTSKNTTNTTTTPLKMMAMDQNSFHHLTIFSTNRAHGPKGRDQSVCNAFLSSSTNTTATPNSISYVQDSCQDVQIGNKLSRIYMTFAMALTINASFSFTCHHHHHHHHLQQQQEEEESNTVIGLLAKYNNLLQHVKYPSIQPLLSLSSLNEICTKCDTQHPHECNSNSGIEIALHYIHNHLRTIFLLQQQQERTIINISNNNQEGGGRKETEVTSVFDNDDEAATHSSSNIDVAIHYRCGDIMGIHASKYGFLPHSTYSNLIKQHHSIFDSINIAIITQPLSTRTTTTTTTIVNNNNNNAIRSKDLPFVEKCYYIVNDLVKYLKKEFPYSTISIPSLRTPQQPSSSSSSIVQDYSMLILARSMTICGPSTFCLWPTLASNNPYIYESKLFPWIKQLKKKKEEEKMEKSSSSSSNGIDYYYNTFTSPRLSPTQNLTLDEMELETILIWLQNT